MENPIKLSIVSTIYQSKNTIKEFINKTTKCAYQNLGEKFEIILVNDGSTDCSLNIAIEESKKFKNIKIIDLSRNFGHHKALMTGLSYSKGELVFLIDSDLEEDPSLLGVFLNYLKYNKADVIYGVQKNRKGKLFEKISGEIYYRFFNFISNINFPRNVLTARLMTRRYVDSLLLFKESELYLIGIWRITGFRQIPLRVIKKYKKSSTYTIRKKLSLVINNITSFTYRPLKLIFYFGIFIVISSLSLGTIIILRYFLLGNTIVGWTSLILSIWLFGGIIISILGILGIYLSKVFIEVKNRPHHIVRNTYINGTLKDITSKVNMNRF